MLLVQGRSARNRAGNSTKIPSTFCPWLLCTTFNEVHPNEFSFNSAMSSCEKGSQWQISLEFLDMMAFTMPLCMPPDIFSFCAAISSCEKAGEWQRALQIFEDCNNCSIVGRCWNKKPPTAPWCQHERHQWLNSSVFYALCNDFSLVEKCSAHWSKETVGLDACGYRTSLELGQSRLVWRLNSSKWVWTLLDPFGSTLFLLASSYLSDLSIAKWEGFCLWFQWLTASHVRRKCRRQKFCLTRSASMLWLEHVRKDSGFMRLLSSLEVTQHNETMWSHACIGDAADTSRHLGGI